MLKHKITLLLLALISFNAASGLFMVVCHSYDGRIAIEPAFDDHCSCSTPEENISNSAHAAFSSSDDHCDDSLFTTIAVILKNPGSSLSKLVAANFVAKLFADRNTFGFSDPFAANSQLSSFHQPLRSIILLA